MPRRRAFTMIELLVVIGVIVLLLAILMPALSKAREAANSVTCASHIKTLTHAFLLFANDHDGHLPGTRRTWRGTDDSHDHNPDHYDWLFGEYAAWDEYPPHTIVDRLQCAPQYGTLWKYVNDYNTYLCPSMKAEKPGSGMGSNGRFDYAAFARFCGATIRSVRPISQLHHPCLIQTVTPDPSGGPPTPKLVQTLIGVSDPIVISPGSPSYDANIANDPMRTAAHGYSDKRYAALVENLPTPLICQEEPAISINYDPGDPFVHHDDPDDDDWWSQMDGAHQRWDQMAHCHGGGSYYGAIDGSVQWVIEPDTDESPGSWSTDPTGQFGAGSSLWWQKGPATGIPRQLNWDCGSIPYTIYDPNYPGDSSHATTVWKSGWNNWSSQ